MNEKIKAWAAIIEGWFNNLQTLNIESTLPNMEKLVSTMYEMRAVHTEMAEMTGGEADGRDTPDPERRDGN